MKDDDPIVRAKRHLRRPCEEARQAAAGAAGEGAAAAAADLFLAAVSLPAACVVSGYWPMRHEFDVRPLLAALHERGHPCALPVVRGRGQALEFRAWAPGDALIDAAYGTRVPPESAAAVTPGLLLVPLLAYDERGYRLGYGGGFYDRSLAALSSPIAVGCAYDAQAIDAVPTDDHDRRLDWIVTEKRILEIT